MKKILFFVLLSNFLAAQHPDLLNTNWKITKIASEVQPNQLPPTMSYEQVTNFSTTDPQLNLSFFNTISANLTYNGQDGFTINSKACTLADYWGDNGEVNQFFGSLCNFFDQSANFNYYIQNNGSQKTLVIHNAIFQEVHFESINLATNDNEFSKTILSPNPVKNILKVQNSFGINSVQIFDLSGKLVQAQKNENAKTLNIDKQNLKAGIYFIKLNNDKTFKIIKN